MNALGQNLLGFDTNPKTVKGQSHGFLTGIMYLAPYDLSGFEVCPTSSQGCRDACLYRSGHGAFTSTQNARIKKTRSYFERRELFMTTLAHEIYLFIRRCHKRGMVPCIRLNGTSDIPWERVPVTYKGETFPCIMDLFPLCQFYDYTKRWNRRDIPANYHLTFSLNEDNTSRAVEAFMNGLNVAIVYRHENIPTIDYIDRDASVRVTLPVFNGFATDLRFTDPAAHIIGLCAKGVGRYDTSGFVRENQ